MLEIITLLFLYKPLHEITNGSRELRDTRSTTDEERKYSIQILLLLYRLLYAFSSSFPLRPSLPTLPHPPPATTTPSFFSYTRVLSPFPSFFLFYLFLPLMKHICQFNLFVSNFHFNKRHKTRCVSSNASSAGKRV